MRGSEGSESSEWVGRVEQAQEPKGPSIPGSKPEQFEPRQITISIKL